MVGGLGFGVATTGVARVCLFRRFFGIGLGPLSVVLVFGFGPVGVWDWPIRFFMQPFIGCSMHLYRVLIRYHFCP